MPKLKNAMIALVSMPVAFAFAGIASAAETKAPSKQAEMVKRATPVAQAKASIKQRPSGKPIVTPVVVAKTPKAAAPAAGTPAGSMARKTPSTTSFKNAIHKFNHTPLKGSATR